MFISSSSFSFCLYHCDISSYIPLLHPIPSENLSEGSPILPLSLRIHSFIYSCHKSLLRDFRVTNTGLPARHALFTVWYEGSAAEYQEFELPGLWSVLNYYLLLFTTAWSPTSFILTLTSLAWISMFPNLPVLWGFMWDLYCHLSTHTCQLLFY